MSTKSLSADQLTAVEFLALPKSQRPTMEEIAVKCHVGRSTIYAWRNDPSFVAALKTRIITNSIDKLPDLATAMIDIAIQDRNAAMAKLVLQMNGMLSDKLEVQTSVTAEGNRTNVEALKARIMALQGRRAGEDAEEETSPSIA